MQERMARTIAMPISIGMLPGGEDCRQRQGRGSVVQASLSTSYPPGNGSCCCTASSFFLPSSLPSVVRDALPPFRCMASLTTPYPSSLMRDPTHIKNQPESRDTSLPPLNKQGSWLLLPPANSSNNGDLLQQGQGQGASRGPRRRRARIPMDARRPVPPPPLDQRRRLHAHQARMEGCQPGCHDRLPGEHPSPTSL